MEKLKGRSHDLPLASKALPCQKTFLANKSAQEDYLIQVHVSNDAFDILIGIDLF